MADIKELIPEFFYHPEFLVNTNNFNLGVCVCMYVCVYAFCFRAGTKQSGESLGDIILPPWYIHITVHP